MEFDPPISTWTDEQLEAARVQTLQDIEDVKVIWTDDDSVLLPTLYNLLNTVQTEILERGLKLLDKS